MIKNPPRNPRLGKLETTSKDHQRTCSNENATGSQRLRVLAIGDSSTGGMDSSPAGNAILDKFCHCLEIAGYPTVALDLVRGLGTSREAVTLMKAQSRPADVALINFGWTDTSLHSISIEEFRENIETIIDIARSLNPKVWVLLWGSPPVPDDHERNQQLLRYNAEMHDIANFTGSNYFPTKPIMESLPITPASGDDVPFHEIASAGIAAGLAHIYLSQLQRTAA